MDRLSIVRSVHHQNAIHAPSAHWMQTGYFGPTLARNAPQKPSFGSVIARGRGASQPHMPPYVAIPKAEAFGYQGAVYLGAAYNPFEVGADPNAADFRVPNLALPRRAAAATACRPRRSCCSEFDTLRRDVDQTGTLEGLNTFKAQALEMVTGDRVRDAFDLSQEDPRLRDRYGRHLYGQSALLARRLVEAGSTCVTINTGYWDHHNDIEKGLEEHLPPLDAAIAALVEDLDERGMLDDVVDLLRRRVRPHAADQRPRRPRPLVQLLLGAARRRRPEGRPGGRRQRAARRQGPRTAGRPRATCWPRSTRRWASRSTPTTRTPPAGRSASSARAGRSTNCYSVRNSGRARPRHHGRRPQTERPPHDGASESKRRVADRSVSRRRFMRWPVCRPGAGWP